MNASNIWQTMVETVRSADTHKVDDTKEDIDTLLVFVSAMNIGPLPFLRYAM